MGSLGKPNQWAPYDSFRDCSQGICSIYCPQWCYIIFPPPPPFEPTIGDDSPSTPFSPIIISVISILASSLLLVVFYIIIARYCRRRGSGGEGANSNSEVGISNFDQTRSGQWPVGSAGLDEAFINSITVCQFKKAEGLVQGIECVVCLGEFLEGESLRLLPKCSHAFHLPCIDTWLKSHSNCPLCRANVVSPPATITTAATTTSAAAPVPLPTPIQETPSALSISSLETETAIDLIFVLDDRDHHEEVVVRLTNDVPTPKNSFRRVSPLQDSELSNCTAETEQQLRRSVSLGSFPCHRQLSIAEVLNYVEDRDGLKGKSSRSPTENFSSSNGAAGDASKSGSSSWSNESVSTSVGVGRSISMGRSMFPKYVKGKNSILPI